MGWCSGTDLFDKVMDALFKADTIDKERFIEELILSFQNQDWDCEQDSEYWEHPVVNKVFRKMYPEWFRD
jgi:hypothetical protein